MPLPKSISSPPPSFRRSEDFRVNQILSIMEASFDSPSNLAGILFDVAQGYQRKRWTKEQYRLILDTCYRLSCAALERE